jgi:hypothetical protein
MTVINITQNLWKDWRLHVIILAIVLLTERIGSFNISVGPGVILLLPMLYAMVVGIGIYFTPLIKEKQSKSAESLVFLAVCLLIARFGVVAGASLPKLIEVGPALLLQELGNLGTIFLALPIAVALGLKRESIGMTFSTGREGGVAIIVDKFGLNSPEGRGVMAMYIFGTFFGSIFMGLISGFLATITPLHPLSFAMASGIGSGSMMAASSGSLIGAFPQLENDIIAFASASNLITICTGLFVSIFVALPLTEKLYGLLTRRKQIHANIKEKNNVGG